MFTGEAIFGTYTGAELNYVEERDGRLYGYEFKYGKKKTKAPRSWSDTYPEASYEWVSPNNFHPFAIEPIEP